MTLELAGGGEARIVATDGDRVELRSTRAYPPGATIEGHLAGAALRVKVRVCKKEGDSFAVQGRFVNLSRQQRERMLGSKLS
jgi:hypothetical protein